MRRRTLFIGSLGLSIAIHALILFTPSFPVSDSADQSEPYRVNLVQKPTNKDGNDALENTADSSAVEKSPQPHEDPIKTREAVKEREEIQSNQENGETNTTDSQLQREPDPAMYSREKVQTVHSADRRSGSSQRSAPDLSQTRPSDHQRILGELNRLLGKYLHYPEVARRKGIEGTLAITLTLNTNGDAINVVVSETSGSRILDRAALRAVSEIFPYPDPPEAPLHFTIPVTYRLTSPR